MPKRAKRGRPPAVEDRRELIMDAAIECFVDRGFYGTAMPEIAKRAGLAAGTLYHYFDGKEALVNALYRRWKSEVSSRVLAAFPQDAGVREQFSATWLEMLRFSLAHPAAASFIELHNHASYLDAESRAVDRNLREFASAVVARAQAQGLLKPGDPLLLMELVFGAFNGAMRAHFEGRLTLDEAGISIAEQACWDAVSNHTRATATDPQC